MTTPQSRADSYLAAWQLLRHLPPELRLPVIDALVEIERARQTPAMTRVQYGNGCDTWQSRDYILDR